MMSRWLAALQRVKGPIAGVAAVGAVLSGLVGYYTSYRAVVSPASSALTSAANLAADAGPLSIVVLPFANLTGDTTQAYVADGLTASVTADLSRIRDSFVVGATAAAEYRDKGLPPQQVARELGVHFVLQGNVQRSGSHLRINAQLLDASTNAQLWAETFEGDTQDLFALQDQVTTRIGNSMGRELVIRAARESEKRHSQPTVSDLVLQARALGVKPQSLANFQAMEALYRKALALESGSLPAVSGLATVLGLQFSNFGDELSAAELEKKRGEVEALIGKVTAVDPEFPGAYSVLATLAMQEGDLDKARALLKSQAALTPKQPAAHHNLAWVAYWLAEPEEAHRELELAFSLDPRHPSDVSLLLMGWVEFMRGNDDAAIDWQLKAKSLNPAFSAGRDPTLAAAYAMKGDSAKARAAVAELLQANPKFTISGMRVLTGNQSPAYSAFFKSRYEPALRKAGFPE